jgi:hypothetical protein
MDGRPSTASAAELLEPTSVARLQIVSGRSERCREVRRKACPSGYMAGRSVNIGAHVLQSHPVNLTWRRCESVFSCDRVGDS